jgi:hypothetical protein
VDEKVLSAPDKANRANALWTITGRRNPLLMNRGKMENNRLFEWPNELKALRARRRAGLN